MIREPCVYIMSNKPNGTLYVGVTSNLPARVWQHRTGAVPGFTSRYGLTKLVWYERHEQMAEAISREKQLKAGNRAGKIRLIEESNPHWNDLYTTL
ncbi:GIY-YIG nuclease family protein [Halopseudomonas phragmitis]|uniref:GIY-YIG nuclease family protein n=1 Tax=Halopseudomonas phragmitis TaxID=1931241 RepID=UPI001C46D74F|nr:GIY-YIG nuclease family protein [Halopseudomonas phragmitis]